MRDAVAAYSRQFDDPGLNEVRRLRERAAAASSMLLRFGAATPRHGQ